MLLMFLLVIGKRAFAHRDIDCMAACRFLKQYAVELPAIDFKLSFEECCSIVGIAKNSAPGPDGVTYDAYRLAPVNVHVILYEAYLKWYNTCKVPEDFNVAYLWILKKADFEADTATSVLRKASDSRPLSGSNCDAKLFAATFRYKVDPMIAK